MRSDSPSSTSQNLAAIVEPHATDRMALIDGDDHITFGQLRDRVGALRAALAADGVGPDTQVAVVAGNESAFAVATLAILGLGGIAIPILPTSPRRELGRKLDAVDPVAVLVGEEGRWLIEDAADLSLPIIDIAAASQEAGGSAEPPPIVDRARDDLAFLLLTSGVSTEPKVAMLTHHNLSWVQEAITTGSEHGLGPDDVTLGLLPFSHIFGLNVVLLASLRIGATVVLQRRFDAEASIDLIERNGITSVSGAPPMWQQLAAVAAPAERLASVRYAASGAAPLPAEVFEAIRNQYGLEIGEGYGLTETSPVVTWSRGITIKPTSVGRPLDGVDVVIADPDGTPVEPGDTGEIVVRSPGVFPGYLGAPELTSAVLSPDGWLWTGDLGVLDDDGYLFIVDRLKDVIIVNGFNVHPSEVEATIAEHPAVTGAVVVGTQNGASSETIVAHVSGDVDEADLREFVRERLSSYKCPAEYHFVDTLPVAPTGKLIRRELR